LQQIKVIFADTAVTLQQKLGRYVGRIVCLDSKTNAPN